MVLHTCVNVYFDHIYMRKGSLERKNKMNKVSPERKITCISLGHLQNFMCRFKKHQQHLYPVFNVFAWQEHNLRKEGVERKEKETRKFTYNASFP